MKTIRPMAMGVLLAAGLMAPSAVAQQAEAQEALAAAQDALAQVQSQVQAQVQGQVKTHIAQAMEESVRARAEAAVARTMARKGFDDDVYRRASRLVDDKKYEEALTRYQQVIDSKGSRIEGAMYWKAYVLAKLGRRDEAMRTLDELKKGYAQSR